MRDSAKQRTYFGVVIAFAAVTVLLGTMSLFDVLVVPTIVLLTFSVATTATLLIGQLAGLMPTHDRRQR